MFFPKKPGGDQTWRCVLNYKCFVASCVFQVLGIRNIHWTDDACEKGEGAKQKANGTDRSTEKSKFEGFFVSNSEILKKEFNNLRGPHKL